MYTGFFVVLPDMLTKYYESAFIVNFFQSGYCFRINTPSTTLFHRNRFFIQKGLR